MHSLKPRQPSFFQRCPREYGARHFGIMSHEQVEAPGHACRYGDSSFYGRWYGSNGRVIRGFAT